jgi:anti-sigma factor RsiW
MADRDALACRDVVELVTERIEGALPRAQAVAWDRHVAACDGCATYVAQYRTTIRAVRALPSDLEADTRKRLGEVWDRVSERRP